MTISNETKVGAITLITLVALFMGFNYLKGNEIFSSSKKYYTIYNEVDGLTISNSIMINGFKVGQVSKVFLRKDKKLLVELKIQSDVEISKSDTAKIASSDLFGTKAIQILQNGSGTVASNGDTLVGIVEASLSKNISGALGPIKEKTEKLISVIDSIARNLQSSLGKNKSDELAKSIDDVTATISNIKQLTEGLNKMVTDNTGKLHEALSNVASITKNLKDNNQLITATLKNVKSITDSLAATNLKTTLNNANSAIENFNAVIAKINKGEGSLGLLINDKNLYNNLQKSSEDLDKLLIDLKANPKRYVRFSVFGGKEKTKK